MVKKSGFPIFTCIHISVNPMPFKNIIKFEFESVLFIFMYLINSNIFVAYTAEHFWENIYLLRKYLFIWKIFICPFRFKFKKKTLINKLTKAFATMPFQRNINICHTDNK